MDICPQQYPLGVGGWKWAVSAQRHLGSKKSKVDPSVGRWEGRGETTNPVLRLEKPLEALCNLVPSESSASRRHSVAMWGLDAKIGKIGRFGRPTRIGFRGGQVEPGQNSWAFIPPLSLCIAVQLHVTLACCYSPRGKACKIGQRGAHRKLQNSGYAIEANTRT